MDVGFLRIGCGDKAGLHIMTVVMPRERIEEQHDSMPGVSMLQYVGGLFNAQRRALPAPDHLEGTIKAQLHQGLWIATCPEAGCSGAFAVTSLQPFAACSSCGAGWFEIEFPENKEAIETELNKRPIPRKGLVHHNWSPGESMAKLRKETKARADV